MLGINLPSQYASVAKAERVAELAEKMLIHNFNPSMGVKEIEEFFYYAERFIDDKDKYIESARNK